MTPPADHARLRRRAAGAATVATLLVLTIASGTAGNDPDRVVLRADTPTPTEAAAAIEEPTTSASTTTTTTTPETTSTTAAPPPRAPAPPPAPPSTLAAPPPTTACVEGDRGSVPSWGDERAEFDPATVERAGDPSGRTCGPVLRVLVVGDSTGTGTANGLRRLRAPDLEVWDRTELGCGVVVSVAGCPDWREHWRSAVHEVRPDVVLVYAGVSSDVADGIDPPFLSPAARPVRAAALAGGLDILTSTGARVVWALPAKVLERGVFFCGGHATDSHCDPAWTTRWHEDVRAVAAPRGVVVADVEHWVSMRAATMRIDRPDGLHMSGPALDAQAAWLADHVRQAAR